MHELEPGLWHWQASHSGWRPSEPWDQMVSSYAIDDGDRLLLFDALGVPPEIEELGANRETLIVLTCPWHERDSESLVERLQAPVYSPPPDSAEYLMQQYGITAEQAGDGSPDIVWLRAGKGDWHPYGSGDRLPGAIEVFPGQKPNDMVLWVEERRAAIAGDTLVDFGDGLGVNPRWLSNDVAFEQVSDGLRPLLERNVEHVLPTHGLPTDRAAFERALSEPLSMP